MVGVLNSGVEQEHSTSHVALLSGFQWRTSQMIEICILYIYLPYPIIYEE